jgi:hypothetical protein
MANGITLPLVVRPANGPMSISAFHCKAGDIRAFIAHPARNHAKFGGLQTLQN